MRKRRLIALSIFVILVISFALVSIHAKEIASYKISKIDTKVLKDLEKSNETIVVVKLDSKNADSETKDIIKKRANEGNLKKHFDGTITLKLNKEELNALADDNSVKNIKKEKVFHTLLQNSTYTVNASSVWGIKEFGANLTGKGQTICIIDTGVNYSHPDLGGCYGNNNMSSGCKVVGGVDWCADNSNCLTRDSTPEDAEGHGTHVAGIAAANGSINGIAPEARIIMFKAGNASGSFAYYDIVDGIDWCVANSSRYNISVISMSVGGDLYDNYCDWDNTEMAAAINSAVAKNITVLAASGNDGSSTEIDSPACIQNVTPVGSTTKADAISSFSNRNFMIQLFAPGGTTTGTGSCTAATTDNSRICSTSINGGYVSYSGTSMATPMAAGAVVIIRQYLLVIGKTKTTDEIESMLNSTGKTISGTNYTRINILEALKSIDETAPNVSLTYPANRTTNTNGTITFRCSATDLALKNATFYLWNSTSTINITNASVSGTGYTYEINLTGLNTQNYSWNCRFFDEKNYGTFAPSNFTVMSDVDAPRINLLYPGDGSWQRRGEFNATINEAGTCIYSLDGGRNISMNSSDEYNFTAINETLVQDAEYNVTVYCNDSSGNLNSSTAMFRIDMIAPNVSLVNPESGYSANGTTTVIFYYNVTENVNLTKCELVVGNSVRAQNSSLILMGNETNNISYSVSAGSYLWQINCTDLAGNIGNSSSRNLTINSVSEDNGDGGGGGGGGGGGSTTQTITLTDEQFIFGATKLIGEGDKINFHLHSLTLSDVGINFANLTINSNPINIVLYSGQSAKINLSSNDYYDLYVKLEGIIGVRANLTIKQIYELAPTLTGLSPPNEQGGNKTVKESNKTFTVEDWILGWKAQMYPVIYFVFGAIIVVLVIYLALKASSHKK